MPIPGTDRRLRVLCSVRLAIAGADAFASARQKERLERSVMEILAVRHVVQAAITLARPSRKLAAAGAAVDALHSLSMIGLAAASPTHRRGALTEAAAAGGMAAAGAVITWGWAGGT